ncbi:MAG: hypothetical protein PF481_00210 [Bacteroidales bacterium]|jgi:hypothetical protein|nr:hypothetical protein [Bacteroidales bacterium]
MKNIAVLLSIILFVSCNYEPVTGPYITDISIPDTVHETDTILISYTNNAEDSPIHHSQLFFSDSLIMDSIFPHTRSNTITFPVSFLHSSKNQTIQIYTFDTENLQASAQEDVYVQAIKAPGLRLLNTGIYTDTILALSQQSSFNIQCIQTECSLDSLFITKNNEIIHTYNFTPNSDTTTIQYTFTPDSVGTFIYSIELRDIYTTHKSISKKITVE